MAPFSRPRCRQICAGVLSLLAVGCGEQATSSAGDASAPLDAAPVDTKTDAGVGDPSVVVGAFNIQLVPAAGEVAGLTSIVGRVSDGPAPSTIVWGTSRTEGPCSLETPRVPFCDPGCGGSAACVEDGVCQRYPSARSVGTVKVAGLRGPAGLVEVTLGLVSNTYQLRDASALVFPSFTELDALRLEASGGVVDSFEIETNGIAELVLTSTSPRVAPGEPLELTWVPALDSTKSMIHVKLDISHHGGTKGMIECDVSDEGAWTLSAGILTDLLNLGVAGFPTVILTRSSVGGATISLGRVELRVISIVERSVEIPGVASCTDDAQCPLGQGCRADLTCG